MTSCALVQFPLILGIYKDDVRVRISTMFNVHDTIYFLYNPNIATLDALLPLLTAKQKDKLKVLTRPQDEKALRGRNLNVVNVPCLFMVYLNSVGVREFEFIFPPHYAFDLVNMSVDIVMGHGIPGRSVIVYVPGEGIQISGSYI